ncbi:MAG: flagellar type III secretion system pore protein FliP [Stagnimonas sp.]|nr:flagellar type III secretion system pore protein FliP [Stagnimonas sp.]
MNKPVLIALLLLAAPAAQAAGIPALTLETAANGSQSWSLSLQVLALMTAVTLLPALLLTMTSFTRIVIVLGLLRQALGTGQTPSNQILVGLALFLSLFVMSPVLGKIHGDAVQPYLDGKLEFQPALANAEKPLRAFMLAQTREVDLLTFTRLSGRDEPYVEAADVPFTVLAASFLTSELTTAFQIGFLIFVPFVVIDLVVSSVLMSLGMMMLSPMLISLPFKLMLFVMVDGWSLTMSMLAASFKVAAL